MNASDKNSRQLLEEIRVLRTQNAKLERNSRQIPGSGDVPPGIQAGKVLTDRLILIGVGLAAFYWLLESGIHTLFFNSGSFIDQILPSSANELWMRLMVCFILIWFSIYAQIIVKQLRQAKVKLQQSHDELEFRVTERTSELAKTNEKLQVEIAERKKAEEKLIENQAHLRSLVSELTMTEERERKEIAGLLHDDLIQRLATCKMKVDELSKSETSEGGGDSLDEIGESIREMIRGARSLTFDLCSPVLYDIGLEAAIRDWLNREVSGKYDVTFEFTDDGQQRQLSEDLRVTLYRAVRELCTNVIKHSKAQRAKVSIRTNNDNAEIIVEDDGGGITIDGSTSGSSERGGLGLFGIRERLNHFGAGMNIDSEADVGTRITITVPLNL
ncbi:MAG: sensor histidine kinase [Planctomycetota bacterium]|jgi:signal transduction histidine kinase